MGRVSSYTKKQGEEICERLASGETLEDICRDPHMPAARTVGDWRAANPPFAADIARAREAGFDAIASRARRTMRGFGPEEHGDSTGDVGRDKAITDLDLKLLSKWDARRYGDKQFLEHSGNLTLMFADLTDDELVDRILELQATGRFKPPGGVVLAKLEPKALPAPEPAKDDYSDIA